MKLSVARNMQDDATLFYVGVLFGMAIVGLML
jgi:hypothetical protein